MPTSPWPSWAGTNGEEPCLALTAAVRREGAARRFAEQLAEHQGRFEEDYYRKFDTRETRNGRIYAVERKLFVVASDRLTFEEIADARDGQGETLADNPRFQVDRVTLPEARFASVNVNVPALAEYGAAEWSGREGAETLIPDWLIAAASWEDRAVRVEARTPVLDWTELETPALEPVAHMLPPETAGYVSLSFDPDLDNWRKLLGRNRGGDFMEPDEIESLNGILEFIGGQQPRQVESDSGLGIFLDLALDAMTKNTGIDPKAGFFDLLAGQLTVAGWELEQPGDRLPRTVVLLSHREGEGDALVGTMLEIETVIRDLGGAEAAAVNVGADREARVYDAGGDRPGYVVNQGMLVLGTTDGALRAVVTRQAG